MNALTETMETHQLLALTFSSLDNPHTWTTGTEGRKADGTAVEPTSQEALRRCAEGWLRYHASAHGYSKQTLRSARQAVQLHLPGVTDRQRARAMKPALRLLAMLPSIPEINDRLGRIAVRNAFADALRALQPPPAPVTA